MTATFRRDEKLVLILGDLRAICTFVSENPKGVSMCDGALVTVIVRLPSGSEIVALKSAVRPHPLH